MVLRLFTQPGEGKHWIVPKRHTPLPANATLENSVTASTILAAGYTSYARAYAQRVGYSGGLSVPGTFVKSSARAGLWCACVGGALNWYYHHAFTRPVVVLSDVEDSPFRIWEKTEKYTVDDGFLAGAGLGLVSAIFLRRVPISWFAKCVGMTNVGAFAGTWASHAWFQYTGERQTAVAALQEWEKRRNLEFHYIYWNKVFMSKLTPLVQGYVVFNAIFKTNSIPEEAYKTPEKYGIVGIVAQPVKDDSAATDGSAATPTETKYVGHYHSAYDPADNLRNIDADYTQSVIKDMLQEKEGLIKETEYLLTELARKQYEYCHMKDADKDECQRRQREIQLLEMTYNRLSSDANLIDRKITLWQKALQQKAAWAAASKDNLKDWTPHSLQVNPETHVPTISVEEVIKFRDQLVKDAETFEKREKTATGTEKANTKLDLDTARVMIRAADRLVFDLEKRVKEMEAKSLKRDEAEQSRKVDAVADRAAEKETDKDNVQQEKAEAQKTDKEKTSSDNNMEPSKP